MAIDAFLQFDPAVKGESVAKGMEGQIDILAWSWGMSQSGTTHMGTGGGAGKVAIQDLSFTKYVDSSSPNLLAKCCTGEHFTTATLTIRKPGKTPLDYLIIVFTDLIISSVSVGGSGGEERLTENITINFSKFEHKYRKQKTDGSGDSWIPAGYDIAKNAEV
jgi:type VI secretion system secreted protein Hcp